MKLSALALVFLGGLALHAGAAISPIHVDIEEHASSKPPKATPGHPALSNIAQHRSLTIKLTNNSSEALGDIVVKYFFIGHDMKDHKLKVLQHGERKASLPPQRTATVESEGAVNTYTEAHTEIAKPKGKSKGRPRTTKVAASGQKVVGYAVQVFSGTKLEEEKYTAPDYKQIVAESSPSLMQQPDEKKPSKKSPKKN